MSPGPSKRRKRPISQPIPQIIQRIPRPYPPTADALGYLITKELFKIWESVLSDTELRELRGSQTISAMTIEKLDALIVNQAETMGWRLGLSALVHLRFSDWDIESNGPTLFKQYGEALAKSARRFQKRKLPPIDDPDLYRNKKETVPELRLIIRNLKTTFSGRRVSPSSKELVDCFQKIVSKKCDEFIHLQVNVNSWVQYFLANPTSIKLLWYRERAAPAALFDSWLAWCKGLATETIRQKISELGKLMRSSRKS